MYSRFNATQHTYTHEVEDTTHKSHTYILEMLSHVYML